MTSLYKQYLARAKVRRMKALRLHLQDFSDSEIGEQLGVSRQRAWKMVATAKQEKERAK